MRLNGRIALVTGAASGIGAATALRFAAEGAHVILVDVNAEGLRATTEAATELPGSTESLAVDLLDLEAIETVFQHVSNEHGRLHVLHNNAAVIGPPGLDVTLSEWNATVDINLRASVFATRFALPLLRNAAPQASVIFTASTSAVVGSRENPVYAATKGAIVLLAKSLALSHGHEGIRFNAICPGPTVTDMTATIARRRGERESEYWDGMLSTIPLGRFGQPEDIANAALFLASDESSFVHGHELVVDGGQTAGNGTYPPRPI